MDSIVSNIVSFWPYYLPGAVVGGLVSQIFKPLRNEAGIAGGMLAGGLAGKYAYDWATSRPFALAELQQNIYDMPTTIQTSLIKSFS